MYSFCSICGRQYDGLNCLRCTQQAIAMQSFGEESLSAANKGLTGILSRTPVGHNMAKLKLVEGQLFAVPRPLCRIGNDVTNDIIIGDDETIARFHAQIAFDEKESEYVLRDIGTKSGTFLNGNQVHLDAAIFGGDQIRIGRTKFYFVSDLEF